MVLACQYFGSGFLIPVVVAFLIVNVLESIIERLQMVHLPIVLAVPLSVALVLSVLAGFVFVVLNQVDDLIGVWPKYIDRFQSLNRSLTSGLDQEVVERLNKHIQGVDISTRVSTALGSAGILALNFGLVVLYVGFLLAERGKFFRRLVSLGKSEEKRLQMTATLNKIAFGIQQ